jgi:hypothetical protein
MKINSFDVKGIVQRKLGLGIFIILKGHHLGFWQKHFDATCFYKLVNANTIFRASPIISHITNYLAQVAAKYFCINPRWRP